jgi:hypothetical protein
MYAWRPYCSDLDPGRVALITQRRTVAFLIAAPSSLIIDSIALMLESCAHLLIRTHAHVAPYLCHAMLG